MFRIHDRRLFFKGSTKVVLVPRMASKNFLVSIGLLLFAIYLPESSFADQHHRPLVWWFPNGAGESVQAIINSHGEINGSFFTGVPRGRESDIHFFLYTRHNTDFSEELAVGDEKVLKFSYYNKSIPTKIVIHGFTNSDRFGFAPAAREAFLGSNKTESPVNLIVVEWGRLAQAPWYNDAARNTHLVGVKVARLIEFLVAEGTPLDHIHVIGHSLGAHVAGFAGSNLSNLTLSRITALDPALPLFGDVGDENRIDPSDASYVDVIHTAGGSSTYYTSTKTALGFIEPRGHADFYVNGGRKQPGCGVDFFGTCSHIRAYEYYFESIANPKGFLACECNTWAEFKDEACDCSSVAYLGEGCSSSSKGLFFLYTRPKKPYAIHH